MNEKLKIVLICHFNNDEIQNIIKPWKRKNEFAPWIPPLVSLFENDKEVEFHIISPYEYMNGDKTFILRGIRYHFFNAYMPIWGRHWPVVFQLDFWSDFLVNKMKVNKIINKIKPDIIHLFGVENSSYSPTILQFREKYPLFITVQGFISKGSIKLTSQNKKRIKVEKEIISTINNYGAHTETLAKEIKVFNPNAIIHRLNYPIKRIEPIISRKKYYIVFFARLVKDKGIWDLLKAVAIIKNEKPNISLCVMGGVKTDALQQMATDLNISENIHWAGFLPTQDDVHKLAAQAIISVLPTYHDIISGTIVESLFLKLPVVAYNTGSIHEVNNNEEIISLVDIGDVSGLVKAIQQLLGDEKLLKEKADKGYKRAVEMFTTSNDQVKKDLLDAYSKVIKDFENLFTH